MAEYPDKEHLDFPCECHFKVIAEDLNNLDFVLETVLIQLGIGEPLVRGNTSKGGKYVTYNFSFVVESLERMHKIDKELRNVVGVRMVL